MKVSPDFIILTEVWISTDEINLFCIDGYNSFGFCNDNYRAGGVVVYAKSRYRCSVVRGVDIQSADCLQLSCSVDSIEFIILAVYRLHSIPLAQFIEDIGSLITPFKGKNLIFTGDINCNILLDDRLSDSYLSQMASHGLNCLIDKPTRIVGDTQSCLDHCFIRFSQLKFTVKYNAHILHLGITDHSMIILELEVGRSCNRKDSSNKSNLVINFNELEAELQRLQWERVLDKSSVSAAFDLFISQLSDLIEKCKYSKSRNSSNALPDKLTPWISDYLFRGIDRRKKLYKLMISRPYDVNLKEYYKSFRNRLKSDLRKAKEEYYMNEFDNCSGNVRNQWRIVNRLIGEREPKVEVTSLVVNSHTVTDKERIAKEFIFY